MLSSNAVHIYMPLNAPVSDYERVYNELGLSYAIDADKGVACLTSPFADED